MVISDAQSMHNVAPPQVLTPSCAGQQLIAGSDGNILRYVQCPALNAACQVVFDHADATQARAAHQAWKMPARPCYAELETRAGVAQFDYQDEQLQTTSGGNCMSSTPPTASSGGGTVFL